MIRIIMPQAKIIAVVNQKGGPGKSTVAMVLAGTLGRRGSKVLVVDADPEQGSATRWVASASDEAPFPASIAGLGKTDAKLHREVQKFVADYDYIVIDCPPSVNSPVAQRRSADCRPCPRASRPLAARSLGGRCHPQGHRSRRDSQRATESAAADQ